MWDSQQLDFEARVAAAAPGLSATACATALTHATEAHFSFPCGDRRRVVRPSAARDVKAMYMSMAYTEEKALNSPTVFSAGNPNPLLTSDGNFKIGLSRAATIRAGGDSADNLERPEVLMDRYSFV